MGACAAFGGQQPSQSNPQPSTAPRIMKGSTRSSGAGDAVVNPEVSPEAAIATALAAADALDTRTVGRLFRRINDAVRSYSDTVASLNAALADTGPQFTLAARRAQRWRSQWFGKGMEELDASEKLLLASAGMCVHSEGLSGDELVSMYFSLAALCPLLDSDTFPRMSSIISVGPLADTLVSSALSTSTHVQHTIDSSRTSLSDEGLTYCLPGEDQSNTIQMVCRDSTGAPVRRLEREDFDLTCTLAGVVVGSLQSFSEDEDGVTLTYVVQPASGYIRLRLAASPTVLLDKDVVIGGTIHGNLIETINLPYPGHPSFNGIAVNNDCSIMAVSNDNSLNVSVFQLVPTLSLTATFGSTSLRSSSEEAVYFPKKMCFSPVSGNILLAENANHRVHEISLDGKNVRTFGQDCIDHWVVGIAACMDAIAVGSSDPGVQIFLFDHSGALIRKFGEHGSSTGKLSGCWGLAFSHDSRQLWVSESSNHRVSQFSVDTGAFISCFGESELKTVWDVALCPSGDIVVVDRGHSMVRVYSPDGSSLLRSFSAVGRDLFACCIVNHKLFVLDYSSPRVQVFT